jgi:hypothetical protein
MADPLILKKEGHWWKIELDLSGIIFPIHYKYGVYNTKHKSLVQFENGSNRYRLAKHRKAV